MSSAAAPHIPVLLSPILDAAKPISGLWLDGTMGAGGYTRALLDAGADQVIAIDRDPLALEMAQSWAPAYGTRLRLIEGPFSSMDEVTDHADGVVLDLGVSSMQLDHADRGFSFMQDGPLDMRMSQSGTSAADLVNSADEKVLADILYLYGDERASRRIARAIVNARRDQEIKTTQQLTDIIEKKLPRPKPGQSHPATRSFQAIRIAVNDELGELLNGLAAAERILGKNGFLAVVSFHSIEDRIVKRYLQDRSSAKSQANRHVPMMQQEPVQYDLIRRSGITASEEELAANPRARSARLRMARRTAAPAQDMRPQDLGLPQFKGGF